MQVATLYLAKAITRLYRQHEAKRYTMLFVVDLTTKQRATTTNDCNVASRKCTPQFKTLTSSYWPRTTQTLAVPDVVRGGGIIDDVIGLVSDRNDETVGIRL